MHPTFRAKAAQFRVFLQKRIVELRGELASNREGRRVSLNQKRPQATTNVHCYQEINIRQLVLAQVGHSRIGHDHFLTFV
jgi:hypothetical protein